MKRGKYLVGEVDSAAATGVVSVNTPLPRPERENALGELLTDGPHAYFSAGDATRISASVRLTSGTATVALEGTNDDPEDAGAQWGALDSTEAPGLLEYEGLVRYARLVWSDGSSPKFTVAVTVR